MFYTLFNKCTHSSTFLASQPEVTWYSMFPLQVKVVHFNNTPMADQAVYLYEGERWSPRLLHNLTTDRDGIASFTLNTTNSPNEDIKLIVSASLPNVNCSLTGRASTTF